jgi:hypothetical protein
LLALEFSRGFCWRWNSGGVFAGAGIQPGFLLALEFGRGFCWRWNSAGVFAGAGIQPGFLLALEFGRGFCWRWNSGGVLKLLFTASLNFPLDTVKAMIEKRLSHPANWRLQNDRHNISH